jgi:rhamnose utilization protein RhaD (predicted bifunctional aldolase and dehydrogenase)
VGGNPLLVQAATGNTSIKVGNTLWIKASGTWLAHAETNDIFVPVDLGEIRGRKSASGNGLTPSIETAMHAVMPHKVVIHVHAANTIAWAVRHDGPTHLAQRLAGLSWRSIAYVPSGLPLARQIERVLFSSPDVLILANHGLVVGGQNCEAAEALLSEVEERLAIDPRGGSEPQWSRLERMAAGEPCWRVPHEVELHRLGMDPVSRAILLGGTLYPCQAMFLGPNAAVIPRDGSISAAKESYEYRYGSAPSFLIAEGSGVLVSKTMSVAQAQVLLGLSHVVQRVDAKAPIRYLTNADLRELSTKEADGYRRRVERGIALTDYRSRTVTDRLLRTR